MKLEIHDLEKKYGEKEVLKDITFTFESGKIYGLLGRNGAGKTTFFNALNSDIPIDNGRFYLEDEFGKNVLRTSDIGYVVSTPTVPEFLTGREFLKFYLDIHKDKIEDLKDMDYYFDLVKLKKEDQDTLLKEYSHGMKNKIQILVNIISNPKIILLDEPLTSLEELRENHIIIFSTHILELATDLCDEIVVISNKNLELMKKENLNSKKYKDKIIKALKEDADD